METFSALLTFCAGNSPVPGEFPAQRPVTRSFDVFFDLRLNERLSKQSWGWWFEKLSRPLWRHCNSRHWVLSQYIQGTWKNTFNSLLCLHITRELYNWLTFYIFLSKPLFAISFLFFTSPYTVCKKQKQEHKIEGKFKRRTQHKQ